jgi:hypothetical protein
MDSVELISWEGKTLAYIIRAEMIPEKTTFLTPSDLKMQVGFVAYPAKGVVPRHVHIPVERHLIGTSEVLIVKKGCCQVDLYNDDRVLVESRKLRTGDVLLIVSGGHSFQMFEDTVFLEIKQGPYMGIDEKERF